MPVEYIEVRGARENNLRDVSLKVPKRCITVFTGVSGSGKSSLVFDTLAAEARRQLNETFSTFIRNRLTKYGQPDADAIENLSTAVVVDQKRLGGNSRSTVGTITDIHPILRLLFSRVGEPHIGYSNVFSFNDPEGMCPECSGIGKKVELDVERLLDGDRSLDEGAILHPDFKVGSYRWSLFAYSGLLDAGKKLRDYTEGERATLLHGKPGKIRYRLPEHVVERDDFEGIVDTIERLYINREGGATSDRKRKTLERFVSIRECRSCGGTRLNEKVRSCGIGDYSIADYATMEVRDLVGVVRSIGSPVAAPMVAGAAERLENLVDIGLGYLSLARETASLSGGESQRIKMVRYLGSSLTDIMYVFDEPTVGLHARDVHRLNELLVRLRDKGNTVLVVEHDPDIIRGADHVVDIGPGAGTGGGQVVYGGDVAGLEGSGTLTGEYMNRPLRLKEDFREPAGWMPVENANLHNLKDVSVEVPEGVLTVVTGVAGSGKSSLINGVFMQRYPESVVVDQGGIGRSVRSNPATYTGIMDDIRSLFASENGVKASLFSSNSDGACPNCRGLGFIFTDLAFLEPVRTTCEVCDGRRFREEVLAYEVRGKSISDVLGMTIRGALDFFEEDGTCRTLRSLSDVGLDYLSLGQPLSTLSGGEGQRIKLAAELHRSGNVYMLDEPTTGLHMSDVGRLIGLMDRLVDGGNSVIVIEHDLQVIARADWIVDLGPEGGSSGGEVLFTGTPADLLDSETSLTAEYLRRNLASG